MTFQQLTYLVEISKAGSINQAAHKLFLSQSGISTAIRELETELGIQFFIRSNRGVEFTPEGREFLGYAVSLLEQKRRIESLYGEARKDEAAPLHFSVSTQRYSFSEAAFLEMLHKTRDSRYHFTMKQTGMDAVIDDVYDHRADIGVIFLTRLTEKIVGRLLTSRELAFHESATVTPCVFLRRGHPLVRLGAVTDADLEGYPYVSFEQSQGVAADFAEEFQVTSMRKPSQCIIVSDLSMAMNILANTDAVSTGSGLLSPRVSPPEIITLPLKGKDPVRLGWIAPKNLKLTGQTEIFVRLLEEQIHRAIDYAAELRQPFLPQQEAAPSVDSPKK